ncbi:MAG: hypothetical protein WCG75_01895 [Armatimonadota bacterium]
MDRLILLAVLAAATLVGCGGPETAAAGPTEDKQAISESKAAWDQNKLDAFKQAHAEDGRLTPGQKQSSPGPKEQASK